MDEHCLFLSNFESCVNVENVTLQLLVNGSHSQTASPELTDIVMHHHSYTELFVCGSGEIFIDSQDGPVRLEAGDAAIVPTNFMHCKRHCNSEAKWLTVGFTCTRRAIKESRNLYKCLEKLTGSSTIQVWQKMPALYGMIHFITETASRQNALLPTLELAQILVWLADRQNATGNDTIVLPQSDSADSDIRRMAVLDHLINSCFMYDFPDSEVAQYLYLSERQLSRVVQKWYGNTLRRIIMEKRIVTAAQLLRQTDTPAEQIGRSVGFQSKNVFCREFQRLYGMSPTAYRKQQI